MAKFNADDNFLAADDMLTQANNETTSKVADVIRQDNRLARINKAMSHIWYLDNSWSMNTCLTDKLTGKNSTRSRVLVETVAGLVEKRLAESPNADLVVNMFDTEVKPVGNGRTKDAEALVEAIKRRVDGDGGGTDISHCFEHLIKYVETHPNSVNAFRAMIATDAEDHIHLDTAREYIERMRALGIVLEVCLIGDFNEPSEAQMAKIEALTEKREAKIAEAAEGRTPDFKVVDGEIQFNDDEDEDTDDGGEAGYDFAAEEFEGAFFLPSNAGECAAVLRKMANATGGTFRAVSSADALVKQLTAQGTRLCLPPASTV